MILNLCITVFFTQLIFIGSRTWNVRAVSEGDITTAMVTGGIVHISWLVGIAIGATSMNEIIINWRLEYIPVVICSLSGGLLATYIVLKYIKKISHAKGEGLRDR